MCRAVAKTLSAESCFLSSQVQQLFSLTAFLLCLRAWSPWRQRTGCCVTNVPALGHWGAHKAPSILQKLNLNCSNQNPKVDGRLLPSPRPHLACSKFFFFSLPTLYTLQIVSYFPKSTRLREQLITPPTVEICKTKVAPGDEKAPSALCQESPLVLSCCNLNPFYKTTLSPSQKLSYSQHLSASDP